MREDILNQEDEKHESYGVVGFSRVQVTPPTNLFGSSIKHGNVISLRIGTAKRRRDFQRDWITKDESLIEVTMSATQFADAITSLNVGDGVPCTIDFVKGDVWDKEKRRYRTNPPETDFKKRSQGELKKEMSELTERLEKLSNDAKIILESKGTIKAEDKKTLLHGIAMLIQEVNSNIPFVHKCFQGAVEKTVTEAKGEIDATYQAIRERLGDKAIQEHKLETPILDA